MLFHVFYTNDLPDFVLKDHQACCKKIGIEVYYHPYDPSNDFNVIYKAHGQLINFLLERAKDDDIICMLDIDCLPHNLEDLRNSYKWVKENISFIGNAQNISHTSSKNRVFAAASMLMIHKKAWLHLGKPDLSFSKMSSEDSLIDTAQNLSLVADEVGYPYRLLLPLGYDDPKRSWQLGPFCSYGGGTTYPGTWHFFRISDLKKSKPQIWQNRVSEIISGKELTPLYSSLNSSFERVRPFKKRFNKKIRTSLNKLLISIKRI